MALQPSTSATAVLAVCVVVVMVPAVHAEAGATGGSTAAQPALVALVAATFAAAGLGLVTTRSTPWVPPLLVGVGLAWLLPSLVPGTLVWHQGVLVLALTVPVHGPRWRTGALVVIALGVALGVGGQPVAATVFAVVAVTGLWPAAAQDGFRRVRAVGAGTVAATLAGLAGWQAYGDYVPSAGLVTYEVALVAVAVLVGAGGRYLDGRAARMQARLLADPPAEGVDGLMEILRDELGDPSLRLLPPGAAGVPVVEDGQTIAVLAGRGDTLADAAVAAGAVDAVRVVRLWVERREQVARREAGLVQARRRVSRAVHEERRAMATALESHVVSRIRDAVAELDALDLRDDVGEAAVAEARAQLAAADASITATVAGTLGPETGGIVGALDVLVARSSLPCTLHVDMPEALDASRRLGAEATRALAFVCSEALANVHKHADASQIQVRLVCTGPVVTLTIRDDGSGGADPAGSGLRGLAERLRVLGGTLRIAPGDDGGTEVVAHVPIAQPVEAIRVQGPITR